jgi:hypothetical protein
MITDNPNAPNRTNRFGNASETAVISVNLKYGRLYFSVFAVKELNLETASFKIFRRGKRWLLSKTSGLTGLIMKIHQGAYYVVSKRLSLELAIHFQSEKPSFLIEGTDRKRKYYVLRFFVPNPPSPKRTLPESTSMTEAPKDPKMVSAARIVERFNKTNFAGRVKTREIINAEQFLNGN